jgi:poly[(R)-3-hydroxyalkanoate] polymerase subunit PhaC
MSATSQAADDIALRVRSEIERAIQRGIRGVEYFSTSAPQNKGMPRELIYQKGVLNLYRYRPVASEVYRVPVLLVMSLINKPYILDLAPGQSLVEFFLMRGFDVYLVDWGVPRREDSRLRLEDYTLDLIPECMSRVGRNAGERDVSIVGYCMGGILSVIHAALHPDDGPKNLVCLTTPVNWDGMGLFRKWADRRHFDVDRLVDSLGNVPPDVIYQSMDMLRPASRITAQIQLWDNMWNDKFVKSHRMFDRWATDQIPFPGECFRQVIKELMWENRLVKGGLTLNDRDVDLSNVRVPFLHAVAEHDHIAPYEATHALIELVGSSDKEEVVMKGGHVSVVAGPNAVKRLWPKLDQWLGERST